MMRRARRSLSRGTGLSGSVSPWRWQLSHAAWRSLGIDGVTVRPSTQGCEGFPQAPQGAQEPIEEGQCCCPCCHPLGWSYNAYMRRRFEGRQRQRLETRPRRSSWYDCSRVMHRFGWQNVESPPSSGMQLSSPWQTRKPLESRRYSLTHQTHAYCRGLVSAFVPGEGFKKAFGSR